MISVQSLSKSYGKKQVLEHVSLALQPAEIHGIVGKNGAGKTTFFNCLLGLESFDGTVNHSYEQPIKNVTGYLPTQPPVISKITGWEYLQLFCAARSITFEKSRFVNLFDLPLNQYAESYSTGMLKKLALQGILLQQNEVFILDEPFNGLDYQSCLMVIELIKRMKESNKLVILSSHIFSTLRDSCDFIHYLNNGTISKSANPSQFDEIEQFLHQELVMEKLDSIDL